MPGETNIGAGPLTDFTLADAREAWGSANRSRQVAMKFCLINVVNRDPGCSPTTRNVFNCIIEHVGWDGSCFTGRKRIGAEIGCSVRTVSRAISRLNASGWLFSWQPPVDEVGRTFRTNHYCPNWARATRQRPRRRL
ncbi:helix-turn-helix domain-containing protein [Oceanibacterium hippocampi]|uniref:MarR family protein n=1 Tax=Oceanibacterium hippocampi TaxID=745714 RepID=A0A1Y5U6D3_9PROT|nr:helix-turn-helix domain-containing protein [Oceanibacterium hippocampi]SLN77826.1 hypothetical protein OCH7691_04563 [Oceanibacterium hippocampi]